MDRLSALIVALALALGACDNSKSEPAGDPPSRIDGAKVGAAQKREHRRVLRRPRADDTRPDAALARARARSARRREAARWRWLNVWATWCKPCVEEMPRIARWRDKLAGAGKHVDLAFVSIDEHDADIAEFRKHHPDAPASARLADSKTQGDLVQAARPRRRAADPDPRVRQPDRPHPLRACRRRPRAGLRRDRAPARRVIPKPPSSRYALHHLMPRAFSTRLIVASSVGDS